jgi:phosphoribosylformylglycinamidine (FGAM) synthase-like amidotransferase family enzyme
VEIPIHRHDHRQLFYNRPKNDAGPIRAVLDQNGEVVGAMAHPEQDMRTFD